MSFSLFKLSTPTHNSDKYDRLSNLLLTPGQSATSQPTHSATDNDQDVHLDATFNNEGIVTDIDITG